MKYSHCLDPNGQFLYQLLSVLSHNPRRPFHYGVEATVGSAVSEPGWICHRCASRGQRHTQESEQVVLKEICIFLQKNYFVEAKMSKPLEFYRES